MLGSQGVEGSFMRRSGLIAPEMARCDDIMLTYAEFFPSFCFDRDRFLIEPLGDRSKEALRKDAFGFLPQASIVFDLSTNCI